MRFMIMHKNDPKTEAGQAPPMELVQEMGAFMGAYVRSGRLLDGAGLGASKTRTRLTFRDNDLRVVDGPFSESKELVGGFAVLELSGFDEAIAVCQRHAAILGGTLEIDVRLPAAPAAV